MQKVTSALRCCKQTLRLKSAEKEVAKNRAEQILRLQAPLALTNQIKNFDASSFCRSWEQFTESCAASKIRHDCLGEHTQYSRHPKIIFISDRPHWL